MGSAMTLAGYYAILDLPGSALQGDGYVDRALERARTLLAAGPCMLQLRAKTASAAQLASLARLLLPAARAAAVPLCVNDRLDVALAVGADAVHLGADDLPLADARAVALACTTRPARLLIGISTHNLQQAEAAARGGADYLGFGPIFVTGTKQNPDPVVGPALLHQVATRVAKGVPVVAIGGITLARVAEVAATGAAAAALIGAVDSSGDPVAAGRAVNRAFGRC